MIWKHLIIFDCFEHLICLAVICPGRGKAKKQQHHNHLYESAEEKKEEKKLFCLIELSLIQAISKHFVLAIWMYRDMNFFKLIKFFFSRYFYSKINSFFHQISWLNEFFLLLFFHFFCFITLFSLFSLYRIKIVGTTWRK